LLSFATIVLFCSIAITSLYIAYLSHINTIKATAKIKRLQDSIATKMSSNSYVPNPANQHWLMKEVFLSRGSSFQNSLQNFFSTSIGATLFFVLIWSSSVLGLLAGVFLSFLNSSTALNFGAIPIVVIVIYVILISQSEIFRTLKFVSYLSTIDNAKLGMNDLKILMRAEYILKIRRKQFLVIAGLLVIYGFSGGIFDLLFVYLIGAVEVLFLEVFGNLIIFFNDASLYSLILPLVLFAGFVSVLIAIFFFYCFMRLVMRLIKLDVPADLFPDDLVTFKQNPKIPLSCYLWADTSSKTKRGVKK